MSCHLYYREQKKNLKKIKKMPNDESFVGVPINFKGFVYAPINEQGVILLFGLIMEDLNIKYYDNKLSDF